MPALPYRVCPTFRSALSTDRSTFNRITQSGPKNGAIFRTELKTRAACTGFGHTDVLLFLRLTILTKTHFSPFVYA